MAYSDLLKDPRWQKKRLEIFQRDNFMCRDCMDTESTLHVHHILYESKYPWETSDRYLITLCDKCHAQEESLKEFDWYSMVRNAGLTRLSLYRILYSTREFFNAVECPDASSVADFLSSIKAHQESLNFYEEIKSKINGQG